MTRWKPGAYDRLIKAAITLFDEQGYDATTVADIAEEAGLTKRTFFRYFSDKREVLFSGSAELEATWVGAVAAAPPGVPAMAAVEAGLAAVGELFAARHPFARMRSRVIAAHPELQERELIKLERLATSVSHALEARGVPGPAAALAGHTGVQIFHLAFRRWIDQDEPGALPGLMRDALTELRGLLAG